MHIKCCEGFLNNEMFPLEIDIHMFQYQSGMYVSGHMFPGITIGPWLTHLAIEQQSETVDQFMPLVYLILGIEKHISAWASNTSSFKLSHIVMA